jgi:predicted transcriptional regulator
MAQRGATKVVTAHLPVDLAERLDGYASGNERSRGWVVKRALQHWLDWEDEKLRLTLEAIEESDRVGTIPHEEVVAYFKSLGTDAPLPRPQPRKG